jgi:hypothetical protein
MVFMKIKVLIIEMVVVVELIMMNNLIIHLLIHVVNKASFKVTLWLITLRILSLNMILLNME